MALKFDEVESALELFHRELDAGKKFNELPLKHFDWNSEICRNFLKNRCRKGNGDDVVRLLKPLRVKDENAIEILCVAIANGAPFEGMPAELTFLGGKEKCKALWDAIVKHKKGREYLELLRSCGRGNEDKKLQAYDYVVLEYKYKGLGELPEGKVIFGKFEEEDKEDRQRQNLNEEQKLMEKQKLKEEQKQAFLKKRRNLLTKSKMSFLTRELQEKGVAAIRTLWSVEALGALHHYVDADDVKEFPEFTQALTKVVGNAVKKGFEETYRCVRAFPLLYGGAVRYDVPPVIEKAFKTYPMLLKAVEKEFLEQDPREKQDYFFFAKVAVTNPEFDWVNLNLARLPEEGVILYNERDEEYVLPLREQLEEIVIAAYEAGCGASIPQKYSGFNPVGVQEALYSWVEGKKQKEASARQVQVKDKKKDSWLSRLFS